MGGDAAKKGLELSGLQVKADEFATSCFARCEDLLSVFAWNGLIPRNRTAHQSDGMGGGTRKQPTPFRERPNLRLRYGSYGCV